MKAQIVLIFTAFAVFMASGQTYTTVQDGDWSDASTWDANGVPPTDLSNDVVNINHYVEVNLTVKLQGNVTLNINYILKFTSGGIEIENTSDTININYGLLSAPNGDFLNKAGTVNFNYGRFQSCNGNYKDESSSPYGTFGIGTIYTTNGNIENVNSGVFSGNIEWCTESGGSSNLPIPENCTLVGPPTAICDDEVTFLTVLCDLGPDTDNDGVRDGCDLDDDNDGITDLVEQNGNDTRDTDTDGDYDHLDIDADNDGIPDNIEAQPTIGYIAPSGIEAAMTDTDDDGIDDNYGSGLAIEDTDGDGTPDYLDSDSDNDVTPDIQENGDVNVLTGSDSDTDGLDNNFDSVFGVFDVNDEITTGTVADLTTSFLDADGDVSSGGDLDYRDLFDANPPVMATIDFDGIDDYLGGTLDLSGYTEATFMAWVKLDSGFSQAGIIIDQDNFKIQINADRTIRVELNLGTVTSPGTLTLNEWVHITAVYNASLSGDKLKVYLNGSLEGVSNDSSLSSGIDASSEDFTVGKTSTSNTNYFKGAIDEVRVFDTALTEDQMQQIIYQEIENNAGDINGVIVPKTIEDLTTNNTVLWSALKAYYPMTDIKTNTTSDFSNNSNVLNLYNITTVMPQTAPMPYKTGADGSWTSQSTWEHGAVWDIENAFDNIDWRIIKIEDNITTSNSHKTLGLIIDADKTLTVNGDHLIQNSWYFELNGTLDLMADSQLIQTQSSDLVTSANGKLLRRQEGTTNPYWYNYWSSPIGTTGATTLTDNNAATNNTNNTPFQLNMLKDESGVDFPFTSDYTASGNIGTYWLYTFINGITYWDWLQISTTSGLSPGVGYTQKGTGNAGADQQYIFQGKPNNGTILVSVTDVGGAGSVADVSKTDYLLGNPYPSALDIHQFIDDNVGVIDGTLQLWQQWSGSSHYLNEYNGGYAQVNKTGSTRAYQFVGLSGANNGSQDGTLEPSRYLPISQGFITEIIADGNVEFNNGQRVFILEADADGTYNNGSVFFKNTKSNSKAEGTTAKTTTEEANPFKKIRLEFNTVTGPDTRRELLLGFSDLTTDGYDYGYDAECDEINNNDLNLDLEGQNMNIQAYGALTPEKVVPLNFKSSGSNTFEIKITDLENIEDSEEIYLRDNLTGTYFDLKPGNAYNFSSEQGKFNERFEIVFQSQQQALSVEEAHHEENFIYYSNKRRRIYVKKLSASVKKMSLISMTGQTVMELQDVPNDVLSNGLDIPNVSTGGYIACFRTEDNQVLSKKIIVN